MNHAKDICALRILCFFVNCFLYKYWLIRIRDIAGILFWGYKFSPQLKGPYWILSSKLC